MQTTRYTPPKPRLGFYYYPDTYHYREQDLMAWLPELKRMGAGWLILRAPLGRAIPEQFITGLLTAGIQAVPHFPLPLPGLPAKQQAELSLLFETYARWGVHYAMLYDRPNQRHHWSPASWARGQLVERFLDQFLPSGEAAVQAGLTPIFPPLEPGGDYWDTSFLKSALQGVERRASSQLSGRLALGAYAEIGTHPLDWGVGGPERWPLAHPYASNHNGAASGGQDQRGFRVFDWYLALSQAVFGEARPILLIAIPAAGRKPEAHSSTSQPLHWDMQTPNVLEIANLMSGETTGPALVPDLVLACNFWLLAADAKDAAQVQAWFPANRPPARCAQALQEWMNSRPIHKVGTSIATNLAQP
jgi:hypothetical protein